jgi:hypothetical protein
VTEVVWPGAKLTEEAEKEDCQPEGCVPETLNRLEEHPVLS